MKAVSFAILWYILFSPSHCQGSLPYKSNSTSLLTAEPVLHTTNSEQYGSTTTTTQGITATLSPDLEWKTSKSILWYDEGTSAESTVRPPLDSESTSITQEQESTAMEPRGEGSLLHVDGPIMDSLEEVCKCGSGSWSEVLISNLQIIYLFHYNCPPINAAL